MEFALFGQEEIHDGDDEKEIEIGDDVSSMSTDGGSGEESDTDRSESSEEKEDELRTVGEDDDDRRMEVLRMFLHHIKKLDSLFDEEDQKAIEKEIHRMEHSKKRIWKKQCRDRLKVLSEYERVLGLQKNHPSLSNFFVSKHKKMERMIASLK